MVDFAPKRSAKYMSWTPFPTPLRFLPLLPQSARTTIGFLFCFRYRAPLRALFRCNKTCYLPCSFQILTSVWPIRNQKKIFISPTTVTPMPTAPTPKDPFTACVIRDTLEMESFASVVSCSDLIPNNFLLQFILKIKTRLRQERLAIVKLELLSPIMLYIIIPLLFFNIFKLRA